MIGSISRSCAAEYLLFVTEGECHLVLWLTALQLLVALVIYELTFIYYYAVWSYMIMKICCTSDSRPAWSDFFLVIHQESSSKIVMACNLKGKYASLVTSFVL